MSGSIFSIAVSGINAAQTAMATIGHNIANVGNPEHSRQSAVQTTNIAQRTGSGFIGQGVNVSTVKRAYSEFISQQTNAATASAASASEYSSQVLSLIDRIGDTDTGLSGVLNGFNASLQDFSVRPGDTVTRQAVLSSAASLAERFQALSGELAQQQTSTFSNIEAVVGSVNSYVSNIADLNDKIALATSTGSGTQLPNDLLDQRDGLIRQLNGLIGVNVVNQDDGSANVFLSNGQALVVGTQTTALGTLRDANAPTGIRIGVQSPGGVVEFNSADIAGGKLAALVSFQNNELAQSANRLGQLAIATASAFNTQQQFGVDRNGADGTPLFSLGQPRSLYTVGNTGTGRLQAAITDTRQLTGSDYGVARTATGWDVTRLSDGVVRSFTSLPQTVDGLNVQVQTGTAATGDTFKIEVARNAALDMRAVLSDPRKLAGAPQMALTTATTNTGSALASKFQAVGDPAVDYNSPVSIVFTSPTTYDIQEGVPPYATGAFTPPGGVISINGWSFELNGAPATGDTFTVQPISADPSGDNRNASLLAGVSSAKVLDGGTLIDGYAGLVSSLGNRARELQVNSQAQDKTLSQLQEQEQSVSGVNLDEEAGNLLFQQQAYQAAGKLLGIATSLFQEILDAM